MKTKCYSVRLQCLTQISQKCYKAVSFDGSEDLIPASQYFGQDYDVTKSDSYFISAWILLKKNLQYSTKKERWFDSETGKVMPKITIKKHIPKNIVETKIDPDESLIR